MLPWCLQHGATALMRLEAMVKLRKPVVEFLLKQHRQELIAMLEPWLPVSDLCAIVAEYWRIVEWVE